LHTYYFTNKANFLKETEALLAMNANTLDKEKYNIQTSNEWSISKQYCLLIILILPNFLSTSTQSATKLTAQYSTTPSLKLTASEQAWLQAHPTLRLGNAIARPPFEYIDTQQQYQGIAADYIQLIAVKLGIRFEAQQHMSWAEVLTAAQQRQIDVLPCINATSSRSQYLNFTQPYLTYPMVIVTNDKVSHINNIKTLQGQSIALIHRSVIEEYLSLYHPELNLYPVTTIQEGLQAVSWGKTEAFISNIATINYAVAQTGLTNVKIVGELPYRFELGMAARNDWPLLAAILQKALNAITPLERDKIYSKWNKVRYEHVINYQNLWQIFLAIILIIGVILYWNRTLFREITRRKAIEQELLAAKQTADTANQFKTLFLTNMSHELRTPLNSIIGYARLLQRHQSVAATQYHWASIIEKSGQHLLALINDLLDTARIEAGAIELNCVPLDLDLLLREVVNTIKIRVHDQTLSFNYHVTGQLPRYIVADEKRLRQILLNLLNNAIKFTNTGDITFGVEVLATASTDSVPLRFSVIDTGTGIPPEQLPQLFTPFTQVTPFSSQREGIGLGLAISQQLAHLMGSHIEVISELGTGSHFHFTLTVPVLKVAHLKPTVALLPQGYQGKSRRLLIVDDVAENCQYLQDLLQDVGFEVVLAASGTAALNQASQRLPDLILLDLVMPDLDGWEVLNRLQQQPLLARIPVVAISAAAHVDQATCQQAGFATLLYKPINEELLFDCLEQLLNLTWKYPQTSTADHSKVTTDLSELLFPPTEQLEELYWLAQGGWIKRIETWSDHLIAQEAHYTKFANKIKIMAKNMQDQEIMILLEQYQNRREHDNYNSPIASTNYSSD
jgi:signal transduction histidine kinase/FixJ family two-component response regulator